MPSASLEHAYLLAKSRVFESGFGHEVRWQDKLSFDDVTEQDFLREAAWVVLSSGMREQVVRAKFASISRAFCGWDSAKTIHERRSDCARQALQVFRHEGKIGAIVSIASRVAEEGFDCIRECVVERGAEYLDEFPFLGPATSYHLAKNLGLDVVKPDRHLVRVASAAGFESPDLLCRRIAHSVGDRLAVVDLVIWRFATLESDYLSHFC